MDTTNPVVKIYGLFDPRTDELRYIGKTIVPLSIRFNGHISHGKNRRTYCARWIKSLKKENLKPEIFELDTVPCKEWQFWEQWWIQYMRSLGCNLTNTTPGGDGYGQQMPLNIKLKISNTKNGHQEMILSHLKSKLSNPGDYIELWKFADEVKLKYRIVRQSLRSGQVSEFKLLNYKNILIIVNSHLTTDISPEKKPSQNKIVISYRDRMNEPSNIPCICGCGKFISKEMARLKAKGIIVGALKGHIWKIKGISDEARLKTSISLNGRLHKLIYESSKLLLNPGDEILLKDFALKYLDTPYLSAKFESLKRQMTRRGLRNGFMGIKLFNKANNLYLTKLN